MVPPGKGVEMTLTVPIPASGPGALDAHAWDCPDCGQRITSSLARIAERAAWAHLDWHERSGR